MFTDFNHFVKLYPTRSPSGMRPLQNGIMRPEVCIQISCQSSYYFQSYVYLNILQIWLKTPIPPMFTFLGEFDPYTLLFVIETK